MTRAREHLISIEDTPYYHCISRCVRRAFLCGEDSFTGKSYEHRKQWVVERLQLLDSLFAIDLCAYAVMSNHFHLVQMYLNKDSSNSAVNHKAQEIIEQWRQRLMDISWYMRCLQRALSPSSQCGGQLYRTLLGRTF